MTTRTRWLAALALAGILGSATATLAQKGDQEMPRGPDWVGGRFARAGNVIINVTRIDYIEIQPLESGDSMLSVYLIGRSNPVARVRGKDAEGLFQSIGTPIELAKPAPRGNQR